MLNRMLLIALLASVAACGAGCGRRWSRPESACPKPCSTPATACPTTSVDPLTNPAGSLAITGPSPRNDDPRSPPLQAVSRPNPRPTQAESHVVPPLQPQPAVDSAQTDTVQRSLLRMRELHQEAAARYAHIDSYTMRLRRREVVAGKAKPEELLFVKFRKQPYSVYFRWLGPEAKGREVIYVQGQHGDQIHTLTAAGDIPIPFMKPGRVFSVSPDSALVRGRSRYPITEAGVAPLIERFGRLLDHVDKGMISAGTVKDLGQLKRPEFETKVDGIQQVVQPGIDPGLPGGGQRQWFFDSVHHLPALVITHDETAREVEYYCHDQFDLSARLGDGDFDPATVWRK